MTNPSKIHNIPSNKLATAPSEEKKVSIKNLETLNRLEDDLLNLGHSFKEEQEENHLPPDEVVYVQAKRNQDFHLTKIDGKTIFNQPLKGVVGWNGDNYPADVQRIQKRLIQLELLSPEHAENPLSFGKKQLSALDIPETIDAIRTFQTRYHVEFWINTPKRQKIVGTQLFKSGQVLPGCITFKLLKEYTQYTLSYQHPFEDKKVKLFFNNFAESIFTEQYDGVNYVGKLLVHFTSRDLSTLNINRELENALSFVLKNWGNFYAIQSHNNSIFSFGVLPFRFKGKTFNAFMALLKDREPQLFEELFVKYGIDIEMEVSENILDYIDAQLKVVNPHAIDENYTLKEEQAAILLSKDKQLYGAFLRASHYREVQFRQIEALLLFLVNPVLYSKWNLQIDEHHIDGVSIHQLFQTEKGLALLIHTIMMRGYNITTNILKPLVEAQAAEQQLFTNDALKKLNEQALIDKFIEFGTKVIDRRAIESGNLVKNSTLSDQK